MSQFYSELINEGDKFTIWVYKSNFYLKMSLAAIKKKKVAIIATFKFVNVLPHKCV